MLRCERMLVNRGGFTLGPIDAQIDSGKVTVLLGPNASGKSTLLSAISALIPLAGGQVVCDHGPVHALSTEARVSQIVALPQRPAHDVSLTVERLVSLGRLRQPSDPDRVDQALTELGLQSVRHRYINQLSVGQAQRSHLARVLAQASPDAILILDEPVAPLDHAWAGRVWSMLANHAHGGGCVLVAAHDLATAVHVADHAWLLHEGALLASGDIDDVASASRLERAFGATFEWVDRSDGSRWLVPADATEVNGVD